MAQAFQQNGTGARFIVDVNHLKSKGSACDAPDAGDGQGNCNTVRVNAATELMNWLATNPTGTGDSDIILIGDYNSYAMEDPITVIKDAVPNDPQDFSYSGTLGGFFLDDDTDPTLPGQPPAWTRPSWLRGR